MSEFDLWINILVCDELMCSTLKLICSFQDKGISVVERLNVFKLIRCLKASAQIVVTFLDI